MNIEEFIKYQKQFDENHSSNFKWNERITQDNIEILEYLLLCMVGEFGEASNLVKKVVRGDYSLEEVREELSEEVIDMFIYVIKLIYQLNIDVEEVYLNKMKKNNERFKKYENGGEKSV